MSTRSLCHFPSLSGGTYADTGDKTVWVQAAASGLDKRQCTAQITLFTDGELRVKPLLIFKGKEKWISFRGKVKKVHNTCKQYVNDTEILILSAAV